MLQVKVGKDHPVYKYDKRHDVMHVHPIAGSLP